MATMSEEMIDIEPLTDAEAEAAFVALVEMLDKGSCCPVVTVASKEDGGVSFSLHFSADRARKLSAPNERLSPVAIFEMGFEWAMSLRGQTLEDSRAVGRTLFSDTFAPIAERLDTSDFNSFENADAGIVAAKTIIHAALSQHGDD